MSRSFITICVIYLIPLQIKAQLCTTVGQTPVTAVYICSGETFHFNTQDYCGQTTVPTPCTDGAQYQNRNPNFYRFNCYSAGTLGFTIVPDQSFANYNWQLFDVTNTNPIDIFTNAGLFVACNWSGDPGETGASIDGLNLTECNGAGRPTFCKMPDLRTGHTYLLMVTNESASPEGYQLTFTGGNAVITDPTDPHLLAADMSCDRTKIYLRLNKQVKCNTLAADGSDFILSSGANIVSATPFDCSTQFGTPSITLTLDQSLAFGTYTLIMKDGNDGNTLIDICARSIPPGESLPVVAAPTQPTPMDSIFSVACKPNFIELIFSKPMRCNSVAPDGSDFVITGPQSVTATPFLTTCDSLGMTRIIRLNLSSSIIPGNYQLKLVNGSDGNTLLNECLTPTAANSVVGFSVAQAVSAVFNQSNGASCTQSTVAFLHNGANGVNSWDWNFGNGVTSMIKNPVISFAKGSYNVRLIVSNGICADTSTQIIAISDEFKAAFEIPSNICPEEILQLNNTSSGNIDRWTWNFGNGMTSNLQAPAAFSYSNWGTEVLFTVKLVIQNTTLGCRDSTTRTIRKLKNCYIDVPNAFTPNGDGKNDFLYPLNALKADNLEFKVYNRIGQLVFATKDWTRKWDGRVNGMLQDTGIYAWFLSYTDHDTGEKILKKGTTILLR